jgi:hypothetical protein
MNIEEEVGFNNQFFSNRNDDEYLVTYNNLISQVAFDFRGIFASIASPTLSKQETVSNLYELILQRITQDKILGFPWLSLVAFIPRLLIMFFNMSVTSLRFRVKSLPADAVYFRSWLEPRCVAGNMLIDEHFRNVPNDISEAENVVIALHPYDYSLLNDFKRIKKNGEFIVPIGLLSIVDIFSLMVDYIINGYLKTSKNYKFKSVDITNEINNSLMLDYLQLRSFTAFQEKFICRSLISFKIKAFIYVFENQSWEKVCCSILKKVGIRLIGIQGSGFSPIFLNFFPTKSDSELQDMPDMLLTVGDLFSKYLVEHGNYKIPIITFAAPRFPYPNNGEHYIITKPNKELLKRILYAFPVHCSQYTDILHDLIGVFKNTSIIVDLKIHPQYKKNKFFKISSLPNNFKVVDKVDTASLSAIYDLVLFNDNSFGIEAMIMGVKSFQYNRSGIFKDERLLYFDLWDTHIDFNKLCLIRDNILSGEFDKNINNENLSEYINIMYSPYISGERKLLNYINRMYPEN